MRIIYLISFFGLLGFIGMAQDNSFFTCPVTNSNGKLLANPFVGGFDSPQFNQTDFDNDGDLDMLVFDKPGNVFSVFLFDNGDYNYAYDLNVHFLGLRKWVRFYDYNQDGVEDIFTCPSVQSLDGVEIWTGKRNGNVINYELFKFDLPRGDVLQHPWLDSTIPVFVSAGDLPSIDDVDGDGDVDLLAFDNGGSYLRYYRNYAVERGLGLDTFDMEVEESCFGRFFENSFSQDITLSANMDECATGLKEEDEEELKVLHAGSTVTSFDVDNDNDLDLLIGDLSNDHLVFLSNGGTIDNAWMTEQDETFPSYNFPADMPIFLGSHIVDVDQDGFDDLLVAPSQDNVNANLNNVWYYRNTATDGTFNFSFQQKDFLLEDVLDFGSFSSPSFVDVDQDGLQDIIVGSSGEFLLGANSVLQLIYLKNVGSLENPEFDVVDEDWLSFSQFKDISTKPAPSFGDLDSDGDIDLLVGDDKGFFYYYENIAGEGNPLDFAAPIYEYQDIDVGSNVHVDMVDLNEDGLMDLVIGEQNNNGTADMRGSLNYLQNIGSVGDPIFEANIGIAPNTPTLGQVNVQEEFISTRPSAAPRFIEVDDELLLVVGNDAGRLKLYNNIIGNLDGVFGEVDGDFLTMRQGKRSVPAFADIDNDGFLEMVLGNYRGGLSFFNTELAKGEMTNTEDELLSQKFSIYPNPVSDFLTISSKHSIEEVQLFDISGKKVRAIKNPASKISTSNLSTGMYLLTIFTNEGVVSKKIVVQ